jgi:hypothetical protein
MEVVVIAKSMAISLELKAMVQELVIITITILVRIMMLSWRALMIPEAGRGEHLQTILIIITVAITILTQIL